MNVEINKIGSSEVDRFSELISLFSKVFEHKQFNIASRVHLESLLCDGRFIVFVAHASGKVVGGLTAYLLRQYHTERPLIYLYDLAVATDFQRNGIGRRLVQSLLNYGRSLDAEEVFVQADDIDIHALEFYRSTGGIAESVTHFVYPMALK